jgi:hypothetical protein
MKIVFNIKTGRLIASDGGLDLLLFATSGRGSCKNNPSLACQKKSFEGPLPVGEYYIYPHELSDPNPLYDIARTVFHLADWGDFRIRLHPRIQTKTFGRNNFFLHGGGIPGSAGCIDVGGGLWGDGLTNSLVDMIAKQKSPILVVVKP